MLNEEKIYETIKNTVPEDEDRAEYLAVISTKLFRDANIKGIKTYDFNRFCAGLTFLAYRKLKIYKTLDELVTIFNVERKFIGRMEKKIKKNLGMKYCKEASIMGSKCLVQPSANNFICRFGKKLYLSDETIQYSKDIFEEVKNEIQIINRSPVNIASALIYISAMLNGEKKNQREVADMLGITENAVRSNTKLILNIKKELKEEVNKEKEKEWKKTITTRRN